MSSFLAFEKTYFLLQGKLINGVEAAGKFDLDLSFPQKSVIFPKKCTIIPLS